MANSNAAGRTETERAASHEPAEQWDKSHTASDAESKRQKQKKLTGSSSAFCLRTWLGMRGSSHCSVEQRGEHHSILLRPTCGADQLCHANFPGNRSLHAGFSSSVREFPHRARAWWFNRPPADACFSLDHDMWQGVPSVAEATRTS